MTKAFRFYEAGGSDVLRFEDVEVGAPGEGEVRLAQKALRRGRPIKMIAFEVGYGSEAAFSRAFKTHAGHSPREWKKRLVTVADG